ncbi:MAG: ERCC4 domain-containing protein, partial [Anaerovoracaceae bacterium]
MIKIIIDTREQTPWHFPPELASVSRGTLRTGDYALAGDPLYAIERKSLDDFVGTISSGWERFTKEIERMDALAARTVIVEASINDIQEHNYNHPRVPPGFILKRIAELSLRNVSVLLCDNPISAAGMC